MIEPRGSNASIQEFIASFVRGRKVLDVGCVDHEAAGEQKGTWLHRHVCASAASVVGVDILENDVQKLVAKGYRMICADATSVDVGESFDVIVAGELIEHLDNPGQFLDNMQRHLAPGGALIVTTPNVFHWLHMLESLVSSPYRRWNAQHVSWYCYFTLENLVRRHGLYIEDCIFFARSRKIRALLRSLHIPCPQFLASSIVAVVKQQCDAVS